MSVVNEIVFFGWLGSVVVLLCVWLMLRSSERSIDDRLSRIETRYVLLVELADALATQVSQQPDVVIDQQLRDALLSYQNERWGNPGPEKSHV